MPVTETGHAVKTMLSRLKLGRSKPAPLLQRAFVNIIYGINTSASHWPRNIHYFILWSLFWIGDNINGRSKMKC